MRSLLLILAVLWNLPAHAQEQRIDTLAGVYRTLHTCWQSPVLAEGRSRIQITVLFALRRDGSLFGQPRIVYETPSTPDDIRLAYRVAVMEWLQRCTPMPLADSMGQAIAGRPQRILIDDRNLKSV